MAFASVSGEADERVRSFDLESRFKAFTTAALLPGRDVQRNLDGTPAWDASADLRLNATGRSGAFTVLAHHSTSWVGGDSFAFGQSRLLQQQPDSDAHRLFDLTWRVDQGGRHEVLHRFDRLAVTAQHGRFRATVGRQAVSWGSGIVFQPMDLFSPFAPSTVDRDYKAGDDLLLLERGFRSGGEAQMLVIARRDEGSVARDASSAALKMHAFAGEKEWEVLIAEHYDEPVAGFGVRMPIGGAVLRTDLVAARADGRWRYSGILNIDYSLPIRERMLYVFGEYFHNGFGVRSLRNLEALPERLSARLQRGEVFNLQRHYAAFGVTYQWHPLLLHSATVIGNLHDGSVLALSQLRYEPGDRQRLEGGFVAPLGNSGDEFGGVPLSSSLPFTAGGGRRLYLRWAYFF